MAKQAAVTFFHQSGFTVAVGKTLLIFSYWQAGEDKIPESHRLSDRDFKGFNNIVVFVPRNSAEHHDPVIYTWKKSFPITYVVSADAKDAVPDDVTARFIREGESLSVANVRVSAFGSTDAGVSLLVKTGGLHIFHAGDLNLWHWREENTLREITRAEDEFYRVVASLPNEKLDICMFPVDPNLGGFYDAGANHFIMARKPSVFFPMHWGSRTEIAEDYARRMHTAHTTVHALTEPRETAVIDFSVKPPLIRDTLAERKVFGRGVLPQEINVDLNVYISSDDPFSETDLPVDLPGQE
ncbi:MAG: hypothetical protein GX653_01365 [Clostridiales bacterium]|nr:hypothetical protein [Clostridiales bacterium]